MLPEPLPLPVLLSVLVSVDETFGGPDDLAPLYVQDCRVPEGRWREFATVRRWPTSGVVGSVTRWRRPCRRAASGGVPDTGRGGVTAGT